MYRNYSELFRKSFGQHEKTRNFEYFPNNNNLALIGQLL